MTYPELALSAVLTFVAGFFLGMIPRRRGGYAAPRGRAGPPPSGGSAVKPPPSNVEPRGGLRPTASARGPGTPPNQGGGGQKDPVRIDVRFVG